MRLDQQLAGGDPRSLGRTAEVVDVVLSSRDRLPELFDCLFTDDAIVRMCAGDAVEKVARQQPEWLVPYLDRLLGEVAVMPQPSVQWHLAQILGEVPLSDDQRRRAVDILTGNLESSTDWIVLTTTMEALTTLAAADERLRQWLVPALQRRLDDRRPAVAKRAAKQLARLGVTGPEPTGGSRAVMQAAQWTPLTGRMAKAPRIAHVPATANRAL